MLKNLAPQIRWKCLQRRVHLLHSLSFAPGRIEVVDQASLEILVDLGKREELFHVAHSRVVL